MIENIKKLLAPNVALSTKLMGISVFVGRALESHDERIIRLERGEFQKVTAGEQGIQGKDGKPGKDGADGKNGTDGKNGADGKPGKDGKDGVSVVNSEIAADGHLVFTLSNGDIIDAGDLDVIGSQNMMVSTQVAQDQITVSATAPASPQLNQLWLDIS